MSSSFLSVLIQRQAGKYGDRVALRYRDYKTETWIPVSWNQFAATVKTVSNALIELGIGIQENIAVFSQNKPGMPVCGLWSFWDTGCYCTILCYQFRGAGTLYGR